MLRAEPDVRVRREVVHRVDIDGQQAVGECGVGQVAVEAARLLRGKHKPIFTTHIDTGDFVVVINAEKLVLTGKKETDKSFMSYSGWKGGEKYRSVEQVRAGVRSPRPS